MNIQRSLTTNQGRSDGGGITVYTVSQKNDNDVLRYNFNAHQPILIIFGRDIAE